MTAQQFLFLADDISRKPTPEQLLPDDQAQRRAALDTTQSFLVQAPAGAGKTELLTLRYLALLAEVEEPEQILAITFTRAATAEMRSRVLLALEEARRQPSPEPGEGDRQHLARAGRRRADARGWRRLQQPHRLNVQTIDSLCLRLAHGQPLLARLGGALEPTEDAGPLYAEAARRTTALLGHPGQPELHRALQTLLLRRDNNLPEVERLLAEMLARRDAWLHALPLSATHAVDWEAYREQLQRPFLEENRRILWELRAALEAVPHLADDLLAATRYAAANLPHIAALHPFTDLPGTEPEDRPAWEALAALLLTGEGSWRKTWNEKDGFPAPSTGPGHLKEQRTRFKALMRGCSEDLQSHAEAGERLQRLLDAMRRLPEPGYSDEQWETITAATRLLRRGVGELRLVFAEENAVDFSEIAQAAASVLRDENSMRGLLESEQKRHLLIDEFQDTSRSQYSLLTELIREWSEGDGRTVFLVGDPLQSIYAFRQAEVALFHETREHGIPRGDARHRCETLQLTHNFRSHRVLVEALNERFSRVFSKGADGNTFVAATAFPGPDAAQSLTLHPVFADKAAGRDPLTAREEEAAQVVEVLRGELPRIAEAARGGHPHRVAVLVQSRSHLAAILPALRAAAIPFRAVELEPLANQPKVHDALMLLRALLHAGDRTAWLTVLRAPWCGLSLPDLHQLAGADDPELLRRPIIECIPAVLAAPPPAFSADGLHRLARIWRVLAEARDARYRGGNAGSLAAWLERTWMALGGEACVQATERQDIESFFMLLDTLEPSGVEVLRADFPRRLAKLCAAPDARVPEGCGIELMTIHKAKGLGFDTVLLPGLHRTPRRDGTELLTLLERPATGETGERELLLAPVASRDAEDRDTIAEWGVQQKALREAGERKRLFYVACTRARRRLHLFATVTVVEGRLRASSRGSLLHAAWPALGPELEALWLKASRRSESEEPLALAASASLLSSSTIERLPASWQLPPAPPDILLRNHTGPRPLFERAHGSLAARARGTALHRLLERLSALFAAHPFAGDEEVGSWREELERLAGRALASPHDARRTARELAREALAAARSEAGRWVLAPHPGALSEAGWQSWDAAGNLRTLRVDRSFLAGDAPGAPGTHCLWIIDYKTGAAAPEAHLREEWRAEQRALYGPQLQAYGAAVAAAPGTPLRYGLYFPEPGELLHWAAAPSASAVG